MEINVCLFPRKRNATTDAHLTLDALVVMIIDEMPITNKFVSVPKEMGSLNCAAFVAGVVKGVLDATNFVSSTSMSCSFSPFPTHVESRESNGLPCTGLTEHSYCDQVWRREHSAFQSLLA